MQPDLYKEMFLKNYFSTEERGDQSGNDSGTSNEDINNPEVITYLSIYLSIF